MFSKLQMKIALQLENSDFWSIMFKTRYFCPTNHTENCQSHLCSLIFLKIVLHFTLFLEVSIYIVLVTFPKTSCWLPMESSQKTQNMKVKLLIVRAVQLPLTAVQKQHFRVAGGGWCILTSSTWGNTWLLPVSTSTILLETFKWEAQ